MESRKNRGTDPRTAPRDPFAGVDAKLEEARRAHRNDSDLEEEIITGVHELKGLVAEVRTEMRAKQPSAPEIHIVNLPQQGSVKVDSQVPGEVKLAWKHRHALLNVVLWGAGAVGLGAIAQKILTALGVLPH